MNHSIATNDNRIPSGQLVARCYRKLTSVVSRCRHLLVELVPLVKTFARQPRECYALLQNLPEMLAGSMAARDWKSEGQGASISPSGARLASQASVNPLSLYCESHTSGRGMWKALHYLDIYHRHFAKFIGQEVHVVEIGVFSGGSLEMWQNYFGPQCKVYGIDIREECRAYAGDNVEIFIGDQSDRQFWTRFKEKVPRVDILIDDGGHETRQQVVSLEEMLAHLRPGGVYVCEDVVFVRNKFPAYIYGMSRHLNEFFYRPGGLLVDTSAFQREVQSVHLYPYVTVIEKVDFPAEQFQLPMQGTEWCPLGPFAHLR